MKVASLCYVRDQRRTLMIHRVKKANDMHQGKWNGLGGKLIAGETPEECARREIMEESGLHVGKLELKGFLTFPRFANEEDWYVFVFVAGQPSGELIDSAEGDLEWIDDSDLLSLNLWEGDRVFIPWLDRRGYFSAKFIYDYGRYVDHQVVFYGAGG